MRRNDCSLTQVAIPESDKIRITIKRVNNGSDLRLFYPYMGGTVIVLFSPTCIPIVFRKKNWIEIKTKWYVSKTKLFIPWMPKLNPIHIVREPAYIATNSKSIIIECLLRLVKTLTYKVLSWLYAEFVIKNVPSLQKTSSVANTNLSSWNSNLAVR